MSSRIKLTRHVRKCFISDSVQIDKQLGCGMGNASPDITPFKSLAMIDPDRQSVSTSQSQVMTSRALNSLRLLQLSSVELKAYIQRAMARNPFLEETTGTEVEENASDCVGGAVGAGSSSTAVGIVNSRVLDCKDRGFGGFGHGENAQSAYDLIANLTSAPTLYEALNWALCESDLTDRERCLAEIVVRALDEDGYLRSDLSEVHSYIDPSANVTLEEMAKALKHVQDADKPGIGARSAQECLELQLIQLAAHVPGRDLALRIVKNYLPLVADRDFGRLVVRLKCSDYELKIARLLISTLDPKPGLQYGPTEVSYLVADVIVFRDGRRWMVRLNSAASTVARLNVLYAKLHASVGGGHTCSAMAEQLREARWELRDMEKRNQTVLRVAESLVGLQQAFFEYGDVPMRPVKLKDVAALLDLNVSTISRAASNKFMQTPFGIVPFKRLFSRDLTTTTGGKLSAASAKAAVEALIEAERPSGAMSDRAITEALATSGISVARRTVTKYRNQLRMPTYNSRQRRD